VNEQQQTLFDAGEPKPREKRTCTPARVGSGPEGQTCGTCRHASAIDHNARRYYKCGKCRCYWTHGAGSDIKLKWAACREWQPVEEDGTTKCTKYTKGAKTPILFSRLSRVS